MKTEEEQKKEDVSKGFGGLSSMISNVEITVSDGPLRTRSSSLGISPEKASSSTCSTQREESSAEPQRSVQQFGGSHTGKWLLGMGVIVGLYWLVPESEKTTSTPVPAYSLDERSPVSEAPDPALQPASTEPQARIRLAEEKPEVGSNNLLTTAQIRYCLAEDIRLDAEKAFLNNYRNSDVDSFNASVADYNSRCGEFRYRQGTLESAREDVEEHRAQLQAEGRKRFYRRPATGARATTPGSPRQIPNATLQSVQQRLNNLGYDAGIADGLDGARTRNAIVAFQRDYGLPVDGQGSQFLLQQLITLGSEGSAARLSLSGDPTVGSQPPSDLAAPDLSM